MEKLYKASDIIRAIDKHTKDTPHGLVLDEDITIILEDLPSAQPVGKDINVPNNDTIRRQAAIDTIDEYNVCGYVEEPFEKLEKALLELPSAQPEIIRCGQCKYAEVADKEDAQDGYTCQFHRGSIWFSGSYCSWAERRTDE